jgi:hypothetical protein
MVSMMKVSQLVLPVMSDVPHVKLTMFVLHVLAQDSMLPAVIVQMVLGIITTFVKIVTINVDFAIIVLPIVVEKVNVLKIESVLQHVIVIPVTMMTDITPHVTFVIVNVQIVHRLDVLLAQVLEQEPQTVTVQLDISNSLL